MAPIPLLRDHWLMTVPVRVITDSASDYPEELAAARNIRIVPLSVRFGDEEILDDRSHDDEAFWRRLHLSSELPETAPPPVYRFEREIKEAHNDGAPGVVVVCMSGAISGTYQSAVMAAERLAGSVHVKVVDTRTLSMAQGFAVGAAAEMASAGGSVDEVAAEATRVAANSHLLAALNTLDFLERGGRIGGLSAFVGNLLNVKPLLTLENGVVAAAGKVRSRRAALDTIAEHVMGIPTIHELAVVHGHASDVHYLIDAVSPRIAPDRIIETTLGPVIATHTGPGVLGVAYRTS